MGRGQLAAGAQAVERLARRGGGPSGPLKLSPEQVKAIQAADQNISTQMTVTAMLDEIGQHQESLNGILCEIEGKTGLTQPPEETVPTPATIPARLDAHRAFLLSFGRRLEAVMGIL